MVPDRAVRTSLVLCALVLVFAAAYFARTILAPVAFALFIVAIVWPLQQTLQARTPKLLALVATLLVILATIAALLYLLVWGFGLVAQWLLNNADRFQSLYAQGYAWLSEHGISVSTLMADHYNPGWIVGIVRDIGGRTYGLISFAVIAFAFTILGLLEVDPVRRNIERLADRDFSRSLLKAGEDIAVKFRKHMLVRTVMSVVTGLVVFCFALIAGIELATAWGVIAFVFNYIPFIGPLFATIFPTLFALVQFESWQLAVVVFVSLNVIQFVTGSYIEPRIAGAALSISPFMVLFAVFFWSFLWGIPGAFIGLPIMIAALALCEEHEGTRWIVRLMSGREKEAA
jgi:predicted PurR-regulated permease PerM